MKFENILPALKKGKTCSRTAWCSDKRVEVVNDTITVFLYGYSRPFLSSDDIMADDWVFVDPVVIFDKPKLGIDDAAIMSWWEAPKSSPQNQCAMC